MRPPVRWRPGSFRGVTALGQRDGIPLKPAPEMVWSAMEQLGADARHALYVGDSEVDVEMARRAGAAAGGSGLGLPGAGAAGAGRRPVHRGHRSGAVGRSCG